MSLLTKWNICQLTVTLTFFLSLSLFFSFSLSLSFPLEYMSTDCNADFLLLSLALFLFLFLFLSLSLFLSRFVYHLSRSLARSRAQTPTNSTVLAWWEYGDAISVLGQRKALVDGQVMCRLLQCVAVSCSVVQCGAV